MSPTELEERFTALSARLSALTMVVSTVISRLSDPAKSEIRSGMSGFLSGVEAASNEALLPLVEISARALKEQLTAVLRLSEEGMFPSGPWTTTVGKAPDVI